jgi:ATP-dependent Clp protease ATP-binding subunit ClpB
VVFHGLDAKNILSIARIQLRILEERLAKQDMTLAVTEPALAEIARAGFDPVYGARPLKRTIQQQIENPLAKLVLEGKYGPNDVIPVDYKGGQFVFTRTVH